MTQPSVVYPMALMPSGLISEHRRSNWVRLQTLIVLRWVAIVGQFSAITVAQQAFGLNLDIGLCFMVVGAAVIANLIAIFVYPENKRLSERELTMMLIFDVIQLSALLFLTGGLHNPFALLILAPVTISATALRTRSTIFVGAVAIVFATIVLDFHIPLRTVDGLVIRMPQIFVFGFWVAIVIGVLFLGIYARRVSSEINSMSEALLATQMTLAREQKISDLAGVVAATAHELGTPLATIKLASSELVEELSAQPELCEDALLISEQADRCRDILRSMGQAGKDDLHVRQAPLSAVLNEAAEPHSERNKLLQFSLHSEVSDISPEPTIWRSPEIVHGVRNLVQNAVDFAESTVWIDAIWTDTKITVRIIDDGRGFSQQVIGRIGDPFVRFRQSVTDRTKRREYQGMGLGLFIAKTLLERSGAELSFANARADFSLSPDPGKRCGAIVEVVWPRAEICPDEVSAGTGLGENQPNEI